MLDLRIPTGLFFGVTGLILLGSWIAGTAQQFPLTSTGVNLWAGLVMLTLGAALLLLARRRK